MLYIERTLAKTIRKAVKTFPAVIVTGPRQSGKTTFLKHEFKETHRFVSLEDPDVRVRAKEDPKGFLEFYKAPLIIDEIQYVPELLSYLKTRIDEDRKPGMWLLTGSQNFVLMQNVSQSLAGRIAVLELLPLSLAEIAGNGKNSLTPEAILSTKDRSGKHKVNSLNLAAWVLKGSFPEPNVNKQVDRKLWCSSYISTYLERDIRQILNVEDLDTFNKFLHACAIRTGQIFNQANIANEIGVSIPTIKRWMSVLQSSYQVFLLKPYYSNIGKRFKKSPKIYFTDTSLATYLMGIHNEETLLNSSNWGNIFETAVIIDWVKRFTNHGLPPDIFYLKTEDDAEIDLVIEEKQKLNLFEIKATSTLTPKHALTLKLMGAFLKNKRGKTAIISTIKEIEPVSENIVGLPWFDYLSQ
ncbi:MAG: hypothetical protein A2452_03265 [Candidatus Firestonebacteria bacterium RIFOXYC2_FULL_39_67]|nr:MAG: hypothetical protein A2536_02680 [Candidatus Firestonebacteria bacterium RIFOXYD2_FULL_39_29]OGF53835.1 MAG: hypothetical protein A2497_08425 [Candidatus Firestonebacteria bacterium RifOxyC12_full_39_7]OGF55287.1 MAG: hypothetical protein A2452_03265 [Candidatus Firestonebacteria bacterium RIFOXYC2_FULL_39_67]